MTAGSRVRVFPHGQPELAAVGTIRLISGSQRSIAVTFGDPPPFAFAQGAPMPVHVEEGITFLAFREKVGPWIELLGMGHYEIEDAADDN
jgi:hypothetical protein